MQQGTPSHEQLQETAALLRILSLGTRQIATGRVQPADTVIARLRDRPSARDNGIRK